MAKMTQAPLVELIIEVRWEDPEVEDSLQFHFAEDGQFQLLGNESPDRTRGLNRYEELYVNFAGRASELGYKKVNRLGVVPRLVRGVIYRYLNPAKDTLFQLGPGIFCVNARSKYENWATFSQEVRAGLLALSSSLGEVFEEAPPLSSILVRYIDAFTEGHLGGSSVFDFISKDLGFNTKLPPAFEALRPDTQKLVPKLDLKFSALEDENCEFSFSIGEGQYNGQDVILMTSGMETEMDGTFEVDRVISCVDKSRELVSDFFKNLVRPIGGRFHDGDF